MLKEMEITKNNTAFFSYKVYRFGNFDCSIFNTPCKCGEFIMDDRAAELVEKLRTAGLLEENYELMCCKCYYDKNKHKHSF